MSPLAALLAAQRLEELSDEDLQEVYNELSAAERDGSLLGYKSVITLEVALLRVQREVRNRRQPS